MLYFDNSVVIRTDMSHKKQKEIFLIKQICNWQIFYSYRGIEKKAFF